MRQGARTRGALFFSMSAGTGATRLRAVRYLTGMKLTPRIVPVLSAIALACATLSAIADEGMWLVNKPPLDQLQSRYGFTPSAEWLEHAQKSAVRFNTGGSGSFVSPNGLVMTNHHVGSDMLAKLSTPGKDLLETGFYAEKHSQELKCPDLELNVLWSIEDVTHQVNSAVQAEMSPAEANAARRRMMGEIEQNSQKTTGLLSQIVTLYQGGQYHLYRYKQYTDVRLVMAPDQQAAYFGGDNDNFEYPRYCLDMCFFRVYENDKPLQPEHYLRWSENGSKPGDLALVFGHPGRTARLHTMDHLEFTRDFTQPRWLNSLARREIELQAFCGRSAENDRIGKDDLFGVSNRRKAVTGQQGGLLDPQLMGLKAKAEKSLRNAAPSQEPWEKIAAAHGEYKTFYDRRNDLNSIFRTGLPKIAQRIVQLAEEQPKPSAERLREYRDTALTTLFLDLYSPAPVFDALEIDRLTSTLTSLAESLGANDPLVVKALAGQSPRARAEELVLKTRLKDIDARRRLADGGTAALAASGDPLIEFARDLDKDVRELRKRYEDEIEAIERDAYAQIAAAKFAAEGDKVYPDATFTLRLSFGAIEGWTEGGQEIAPFTVTSGLYERSKDRKNQYPFNLPEAWVKARKKLSQDTPFNFVCSADIIGGNSGSPVVNTDGEVIGLIFDGNVHSLVGNFIYDERLNRAVSVDSRIMIEAMRKVYNAGKLADEITGAKRR